MLHMKRIVFFSFLGLIILSYSHNSRATTGNANDFLVVDCLLPGQVRKLGQIMTYVTARQAIKTTTTDCEIRGGEYVAYDRANYTTALSVWMPLANSGDKAAQTYIGEIYEKGLGTPPDYAMAAAWYRKAAEQGETRAQMNLGNLYERGLGVPKDPAEALKWYRKAAGLGGTVALDSGETAALKQALEQSRKGEESLRKQLEDVRRQLRESQDALKRRKDSASLEQRRWEQDRRALESQKQQAIASGNGAKVSRLEAQISERTEALAHQRDEMKRLEQDAERYRQQLASLEQERRQTKSSLQAEVERQKSESASLRHQLEEARKAPLPAPVKTNVAMLGPTIEIIDPAVSLTRTSVPSVKTRGGGERVVVGKVNAPAGIFNVTVNEREQKLDNSGLFRTPVPVLRSNTKVTVIAVDRQGKRANLEFMFVPESVDAGAPDAMPESSSKEAALMLAAQEFGPYHALVIGNNNYTRLPKLEMAIADAKAVGDVLNRRYGFKVTTLTNANRYEILSALSKLREQLTEKDNLVIYYAGHGELEKVNQRGYWLPVDAEPTSTANWISNTDITDMLNIMSAKHVLLIVDSCYSGTLTRSAMTQIEAGTTREAKINWLRTVTKKRSRTVLTSGGVVPVMDAGGGEHSVFAKALLDVLNSNDEVLEGSRLYREIAARVAYAATRYKVEQVPEYAPIKYAGHDFGDFLFVPGAKTAALRQSDVFKFRPFAARP